MKVIKEVFVSFKIRLTFLKTFFVLEKKSFVIFLFSNLLHNNTVFYLAKLVMTIEKWKQFVD